jgi:hypothetical protein
MTQIPQRAWIVLPLLGAMLSLGVAGTRFVLADDEAPAAALPGDDLPAEEGAVADEPIALQNEQDVIVQRFRQFERNLLVMAQYLRKVQPEQADLIERAIKQSKGRQVSQQMQAIIDLLAPGNEQFGEAIDRQDEIVTELRALLVLLQSGSRQDEIEREKKRIADLIKDLNTVIRNEQDVRTDTERGGDLDEIANRQQKVAEQADRLVQKIDRQDAERRGDPAPGEGDPTEGKPGEGKPGEGEPGEGKPGEGKPGEGKPGEGKPGEGKPGEGKPGEGKPGEGKPGEGKPGEGKPGEGKPGEGKPGEPKPGEGKPGDPKPGEAKPGEAKPGEAKPGEGKPGEGKPGEGKPGEGKPGEGKPGEGKPGEGKPGEGQPGEGEPGDPGDSGSPPESEDDYPNKTPGRNEIEKARDEMERAIQELKKKERDNASGHQDKALAELQKAKEKLEEILRQLRDEERKLLLAALEARFQKMREMQIAVYNGTVGLSKVPAADFGTLEDGRVRKLSAAENEIAVEAQKALTLLQEEGSSVAFPEAVEQLREDMLIVAARLHPDYPETDPRADVGEVTQVIERDIIEALGELIEALQKEMEKGKKPPPPGPPGEPQDPGLVDKLAELKMLRSLQFRINRRTKLLGREIDGEQATEAELVDQLQQLSRRQASIQKAAYDLATGRNQ